MNYENLIREDLEELKNIAKKQKLVRDEKRIEFLILLKSGEGKTQNAAGLRVGWRVAAVAKDLADLSAERSSRSFREKRKARIRETVER